MFSFGWAARTDLCTPVFRRPLGGQCTGAWRCGMWWDSPWHLCRVGCGKHGPWESRHMDGSIREVKESGELKEE